MDPPLPLRRPEREGLRRPRRDPLTDGTSIVDEIAVADAHPLGARPFARERLHRASSACSPSRVLEPDEIERFLDARRSACPSSPPAELEPASPISRPRAAGVVDVAVRHVPNGTASDAVLAPTPAAEKRRLFRERLASGELLRFPGAFNPLSARLIEEKGFEGVYISGAVLARRPRPARHRPHDPHRGRRPRRSRSPG